MTYENPIPEIKPGEHPRWCCCASCMCVHCGALVGKEHEPHCRKGDPEGFTHGDAMLYLMDKERDQRLGHRCRWSECNAHVLWVFLESGRRIKVNASPDPEGRYVIAYSPGENRFSGVLFDPASHAGRNRYTDHVETCVDTVEWRMQKAKEEADHNEG